MRKNLYYILLLATLNCFSQYVRIADMHFKERLQQLYPTCFNNAGLMDTSSKAIITATDLDLSNASISSLDGIQYFKNLSTLNCASNNLKTLPILPMKLRSLDCRDNQLASLPLLPQTLKSLDCSHNQLSSLGALPLQLGYLLCEYNHIRRLPLLPSTLKTLWAFGNCFEETPTNPNPTLLTTFMAMPNGNCSNLNARTSDVTTVEGSMIYPNPAQDLLYFNISSKTATYRIFDAIGMLRLSYTGSDKSLDITPLSPGIYFIKIHSDAGDHIQKFTKE